MRLFTILALALAVGLATAASPFASSSPDGLERVAEDKAFIEQAKDPGYEVLPDYTIPGVDNEAVSTILAGIVGVLVVAALTFGAGWLLRRRRAGAEDTTSSHTDAPRPGARV